MIRKLHRYIYSIGDTHLKLIQTRHYGFVHNGTKNMIFSVYLRIYSEKFMDILTLCNKIKLQPQIKTRVFEFANNFDFNTVDKQLKFFLIYEKMNDAQLEL